MPASHSKYCLSYQIHELRCYEHFYVTSYTLASLLSQLACITISSSYSLLSSSDLDPSSCKLLVYSYSATVSYYHSVGRRYIGMARTPTSRNTFSKPQNSQTKAFHVASYTPGPLL